MNSAQQMAAGSAGGTSVSQRLLRSGRRLSAPEMRTEPHARLHQGTTAEGRKRRRHTGAHDVAASADQPLAGGAAATDWKSSGRASCAAHGSPKLCKAAARADPDEHVHGGNAAAADVASAKVAIMQTSAAQAMHAASEQLTGAACASALLGVPDPAATQRRKHSADGGAAAHQAGVSTRAQSLDATIEPDAELLQQLPANATFADLAALCEAAPAVEEDRAPGGPVRPGGSPLRALGAQHAASHHGRQTQQRLAVTRAGITATLASSPAALYQTSATTTSAHSFLSKLSTRHRRKERSLT